MSLQHNFLCIIKFSSKSDIEIKNQNQVILDGSN
jgi:hypothetical protein